MWVHLVNGSDVAQWHTACRVGTACQHQCMCAGKLNAKTRTPATPQINLGLGMQADGQSPMSLHRGPTPNNTPAAGAGAGAFQLGIINQAINEIEVSSATRPFRAPVQHLYMLSSFLCGVNHMAPCLITCLREQLSCRLWTSLATDFWLQSGEASHSVAAAQQSPQPQPQPASPLSAGALQSSLQQHMKQSRSALPQQTPSQHGPHETPDQVCACMCVHCDTV